MTVHNPAETFGLTRAQRDCLLVIQELTGRDGVAPSLGEINHELGYASRANIHRLLTLLRERGFIDWLRYRSRSIVVRRPIPMPADPEIVGTFEAPELARQAVSA